MRAPAPRDLARWPMAGGGTEQPRGPSPDRRPGPRATTPSEGRAARTARSRRGRWPPPRPRRRGAERPLGNAGFVQARACSPPSFSGGRHGLPASDGGARPDRTTRACASEDAAAALGFPRARAAPRSPRPEPHLPGCRMRAPDGGARCPGTGAPSASTAPATAPSPSPGSAAPVPCRSCPACVAEPPQGSGDELVGDPATRAGEIHRSVAFDERSNLPQRRRSLGLLRSRSSSDDLDSRLFRLTSRWNRPLRSGSCLVGQG